MLLGVFHDTFYINVKFLIEALAELHQHLFLGKLQLVKPSIK